LERRHLAVLAAEMLMATLKNSKGGIIRLKEREKGSYLSSLRSWPIAGEDGERLWELNGAAE